MEDAELRELVREAIARHTTPQAVAPPARPSFDGRHASHALLAIVAGGEGDGACIIEPAVLCNHCGYCQSFGH